MIHFSILKELSIWFRVIWQLVDDILEIYFNWHIGKLKEQFILYCSRKTRQNIEENPNWSLFLIKWICQLAWGFIASVKMHYAEWFKRLSFINIINLFKEQFGYKMISKNGLVHLPPWSTKYQCITGIFNARYN